DESPGHPGDRSDTRAPPAHAFRIARRRRIRRPARDRGRRRTLDGPRGPRISRGGARARARPGFDRSRRRRTSPLRMRTAFEREGAIRSVDLLAAFATLWTEKASGILDFSRPGETIRFEISDGDVLDVSTSDPDFQ